MTQEEKSIQIAKKLVGNLDDQLYSEVIEKSALYGALNMAKWQKQQMIEKACKQLKTMITEITYHTENSIAEHYDIDEFVDDFKKAMEGEQ